MKNLPKINKILDLLYMVEEKFITYEMQAFSDQERAKGDAMDLLMSLISILEDEHCHVAHTEAEGFI
jgi:hypothetical protein